MTQNQLMIPVRRLTSGLSIAVLSIFAISGCSDSKSTDNNGGFDPKFSPQVAEIVVGDTIRWTMVSGTHSVTSGTSSTALDAGQLFDETDLAQGESFSFVFNTAGTYVYFCRPHEADGMTGTVNVESATTKTVAVSAAGVTFGPSNVVIDVGDAVKWTSSGSHTVTSGTGSSDANVGVLFDEVLNSGQTYTHVFTSAGTFPYFCRPHEGSGMKGTVTVIERTSKTVEVEASI